MGEILFEFTPAPGREQGAPSGVAIRLMEPLPQLLAAVHAEDLGASPLQVAGPSLAHVPGQDTDAFAQLEAEMVADSLAAAQAQRRAQVRARAGDVLAGAGAGSLDVVLDVDASQDMVEWLNRMYVTLRTRDLEAGCRDLQVGAEQSAAELIGVVDEHDERGPLMGPLAALFAVLVDELQQALVEVDQ